MSINLLIVKIQMKKLNCRNQIFSLVNKLWFVVVVVCVGGGHMTSYKCACFSHYREANVDLKKKVTVLKDSSKTTE